MWGKKKHVRHKYSKQHVFMCLKRCPEYVFHFFLFQINWAASFHIPLVGNHCSNSIQSPNSIIPFLFSLPAFLSFLCIFESWLTELTPLTGDVIALRFLLFLNHLYGVVLLLTTPLIAVENLTRSLWSHSVVTGKTVSQTVMDSDGQRCYLWEVTVEEKDSAYPDKDKQIRLSHVVSYICCLSVWVIVAFDVRWRWKLEEVWASACLHTTDSLIRCLPGLLSPMSSTVSPCTVMALLLLLLLLLTMSTGLQRPHRAPAQMARTRKQNHGVNKNCDSCWQDLVPVPPAPSKPVHPGMLVSAGAQCVDPQKTESSCTVHRACSWNSMQMSTLYHGDFVIICPECFSAGQEHERTKAGTPLTFITENHVNSQYRSQCVWRQWGFPCLGVNVMIGFMGVLSIFVLPLILSVNILLIRTIETQLELCIQSFVVSPAANTRNTSTSHKETLA